MTDPTRSSEVRADSYMPPKRRAASGARANGDGGSYIPTKRRVASRARADDGGEPRMGELEETVPSTIGTRGGANWLIAPPAKAPPLRADDIIKLDERGRRMVLGRWNSRLRGLKRRADDCARQFPTASVVLLFTKPFRAARRAGRWYVRGRTTLLTFNRIS